MSYAGYVFTAYAVFVLVLAWDFVAPRLRIRHVLRQLQLQQRRRAARSDGNSSAPHTSQDLPR